MLKSYTETINGTFFNLKTVFSDKNLLFVSSGRKVIKLQFKNTIHNFVIFLQIVLSKYIFLGILSLRNVWI